MKIACMHNIHFSVVTRGNVREQKKPVKQAFFKESFFEGLC